METLFAVSPPGLAPFTAQELHRLQLHSASGPAENDDHAGVEFPGDLAAIYRANLHLRTANRLLVRLGEFEAVGFVELRKRASRLPWERYLKPGQPVALRVTCHKSRLYHSDAVAERVAWAIGDHLGKPSSVQKHSEQDDGEPTDRNPPQLITVRLLHDRCTISVDSSGELLHRRGYRLALAKAPLRETLAAGMVLASGWLPDANSVPAPLLDPFCGSGVIPIEAALLARGIAPGRHRRFAFMDWPGFDAALWSGLVADADQQSRDQSARQAGPLRILASDRDAGAIEQAQANAERAGVADAIEFSVRAISAIEPPKQPGWVVTNPPYGIRITADQDLRHLYARFGAVLRSKCLGWRVAILCSEPQLLRETRLTLDSQLSLVNGGVPVRLGRGVV